MKQLLYGLFSISGAFGLWALLASAQGSDSEVALPSALSEGSALLALNLVDGTGEGFAGLAADTPVTVLEVDGTWLLLEYPNQVGGPAWVNSQGIVSFQTRR
jgi:hypothetical protein